MRSCPCEEIRDLTASAPGLELRLVLAWILSSCSWLLQVKWLNLPIPHPPLPRPMCLQAQTRLRSLSWSFSSAEAEAALSSLVQPGRHSSVAQLRSGSFAGSYERCSWAIRHGSYCALPEVLVGWSAATLVQTFSCCALGRLQLQCWHSSVSFRVCSSSCRAKGSWHELVADAPYDLVAWMRKRGRCWNWSSHSSKAASLVRATETA